MEAGTAAFLAAALLCLPLSMNAADARITVSEAGDTIVGVPRIIDGDTLVVSCQEGRDTCQSSSCSLINLSWPTIANADRELDVTIREAASGMLSAKDIGHAKCAVMNGQPPLQAESLISLKFIR